MAINLLGNLTNPFQTQAQPSLAGGMSVYKPPLTQPAGTAGMNTPNGTKYVPIVQPMGVTAKIPSVTTNKPATTLPKVQQNPVVTPPPTITAPSAPVNPKPTFSGLLGQAVNTATAGAPAAVDYAAKAAEFGAGSIPIAQQARDIAQQFGQKYADIGNQGAKFEAGQLSTGTSPVAEGNAAVTEQTTAAQQAANAQGEQAALQGIGYQLTGQQQAQQAAQAASGVPLGIYGQQLTALNNAANLAQPNLGSIGQVPYNPTDLSQGSPLGAPGGTAADAAKVAGGFQGAQAAAAAPGQAQATNIQTAGTAGVSTAAQGYQQVAQNYNQMSALNSTADLQAKQVKQVLASTGLNNTSSSDYNTAINKLSGRLGSANVTGLETSLQELRTAYTNLLSSTGMTPTGSEQQSLAVLDSGHTPSQIDQAIFQLQTAAYNRLAPQYQQLQTYQQAAGIGGSTGNTPSGAQGWL